MKVIVALVLAAVLQAAASAQKTEDPEVRNKRAVSVAPPHRANSAEPQQRSKSTELRRSQPAAISAPNSGAPSSRDLAKIEQTSVQQMKTTHQANARSRSGSPAVPAAQPQTKSKPMKFSYHPPQAAGKTNAGKNPPPRPVRSRPETH